MAAKRSAKGELMEACMRAMVMIRSGEMGASEADKAIGALNFISGWMSSHDADISKILGNVADVARGRAIELAAA